MKHFITTADNEIVYHESYKSKSRRLTVGVGVNDCIQPVEVKTTHGVKKDIFYRTWKNMLVRAYYDKYHSRNPTYKNVSVCEEWLRFSVFREWMMKQDWVGKHLDKDIIKPNNKHYSPDACVFISEDLNYMMNSHDAGRGKLKIGVTQDSLSKKYRARINKNGKSISIGTFYTEQEANTEYVEAKIKYIQEAISRYSGEKKEDVIHGLNEHISILRRRSEA